MGKKTEDNINHLSEEELAIYADALTANDLNSLPESILVHVEECDACKKKILFIVEVMNIDSSGIHVKDFRENVLNSKLKVHRIIKIAALILIVLGIGTLVYYILPEKNNVITTNIHKKDTIKKEIIAFQNKAADNQGRKSNVQEINKNIASRKEYPLFENLVSSNYRGNEAEVFSPKNNQTFKTGGIIKFSFRLNEPGDVIMKIYNNKGEQIFEKSGDNDSLITIPNKFNPGLYYWKLEDEEDLLHVGKFFIEGN